MRIYIAGAYTAPTPEAVYLNVVKAMEAGRLVYLRGHEPVVPHLYHFLHIYWQTKGTDVPSDTWAKWGMDSLETCDAILMLEGWWASKGAKTEYQKAMELGLQIFYRVNDIPREVNDD